MITFATPLISSGQSKRPRPGRLAQSQRPLRSKWSAFTRVRPALQNTKSCPLRGSSSNLPTGCEPIRRARQTPCADRSAPTTRYTLRAPAPTLSIRHLPSRCRPTRGPRAHRIRFRSPATAPLPIPSDSGPPARHSAPPPRQSAHWPLTCREFPCKLISPIPSRRQNSVRDNPLRWLKVSLRYPLRRPLGLSLRFVTDVLIVMARMLVLPFLPRRSYYHRLG